MEYINNAKVNTTSGTTMVTFDCGEYYYTCNVESTLFPPQISDKYMEILKKSFTGYTDDISVISGSFEHDNYTQDNMYHIKVVFKTAFFNFENVIGIPLKVHKKDKVDYLESKIGELKNQLKDKVDYFESKVETLNNQLVKLMNDNNKLTHSKTYHVEEIDNSSSEQKEAEPSSESESSDDEDIKAKTPIKSKHSNVKKQPVKKSKD